MQRDSIFVFVLKTISHITFSVLLFTLSVGITVSKHYSNGKLYSESIFGKAESCNSSDNGTCSVGKMCMKCEMNFKSEQKKKTQNSCSCKDTFEYLHFDADYTVSEKLKIIDGYPNDVPFFNEILLFNSFISQSKKILKNNNSSSPPKVSNSVSFLQVFRC